MLQFRRRVANSAAVRLRAGQLLTAVPRGGDAFLLCQSGEVSVNRKKPGIMTLREARLARRRMTAGEALASVAADMSYPAEMITATIQKVRDQNREKVKKFASTGQIAHGRATTTTIPEYVLVERDVTLSLAPRDLTAELFGDPLPGRSALDRLRVA